MNSEKKWIKSKELTRHHSLNAIRQTDIPVGYILSMHLPTHRCGKPGYAFFASATSRLPGQPLLQQVPDRWFVMDALTGHLLVYALLTVFPFGDTSTWDAISIPSKESTAEARAIAEKRMKQMDLVAPAFFEGWTIDMQERQLMLELLHDLPSTQILSQYQVLAPDFFDWLKS